MPGKTFSIPLHTYNACTYTWRRRSEEREETERESESTRGCALRVPNMALVRPAKVLTAPWGIFVPVQRLGRSLARSTLFLPPRSPLNKYLNRTTTTTPPLVAARSASRSRYYAFPSLHARTHADTTRVCTCGTTRRSEFSRNCTTRDFEGAAHAFHKTRSLDNEIYARARSLAASTLDRWTLSLVDARVDPYAT